MARALFSGFLPPKVRSKNNPENSADIEEGFEVLESKNQVSTTTTLEFQLTQSLLSQVKAG